MLCSFSTQLTESSLQTIAELEKSLGKTLLSFSCHELKPSALSDAELQRIQEVEAKLGVSLVAVEA